MESVLAHIGRTPLVRLEHRHVGPPWMNIRRHTALTWCQTNVNASPVDKILINRQGCPLLARARLRVKSIKQNGIAVLIKRSTTGCIHPITTHVLRHQGHRQMLPVYHVPAAGVPPSHTFVRTPHVREWCELKEYVVPPTIIESSGCIIHPLGRRSKMEARACRILCHKGGDFHDRRHGPLPVFPMGVFGRKPQDIAFSFHTAVGHNRIGRRPNGNLYRHGEQ